LKKGILVFFALTFIITLASCDKSYRIDENLDKEIFVISPDGRRLGFSYALDNSEYVWIDGRVSGPYDKVTDIRFSPTGDIATFSYVKNGLYCVKVNRDTYGGFTALGGEGVVFDKGLSRWGFVAFEKLNSAYVFISGKKFGVYQDAGFINFDTKGENFAFVFIDDGKWYICDKGENSGPYEDNPIPFFNSHSDKMEILFVGNTLKTIKDAGGVGEEISIPLLSPDASIAVLLHRKENKMFVNIDGVNYGGYDYISLPVFSHSGKRVAFKITDKGKDFVFIDGEISEVFDKANIPVFSNDGSMAGFSFQKDGDYYINVNGKIYGKYNNVDLTFDKENNTIIGYAKGGIARIEMLETENKE